MTANDGALRARGNVNRGLQGSRTIGIVDGGRCAGGRGDDSRWAGLKDYVVARDKQQSCT